MMDNAMILYKFVLET